MNRKSQKNLFFVIVEKEDTVVVCIVEKEDTVVVCPAMVPSHGGNGGFVRREDRGL